MKKIALGLSALSLIFSVSCAIVPYAREVKKKPSTGGTIALRTHHSAEDRAQADLLMRTNCSGGDVKVVEEGEVVVGQVTQSNANKNYNSTQTSDWGGVTFGSYNPGESTSTTAQTSALKEWQIEYNCIAKTAVPATEKVAKKSKIKKAN